MNPVNGWSMVFEDGASLHSSDYLCCADQQDVRQRLNLRWGVIPFRMDFDPNPEANIYKTFSLLKTRTMINPGDLVIVLSDLKPEDGQIIRSIQLRRVPNGTDQH